MSAESLRSEVRPHLAIHHVLKSADQIYNKDVQVYTQLQTQHAHVPAGVKSKDNQHGGDGGKQQFSGAQNKLQQGIEAAKRAVDDALQGHSTDGGCSSGEVETLRKEVEQLKAGNQKLSTEVAEIRKMLQQLRVSVKIFELRKDPLCSMKHRTSFDECLRSSVLVLGDGNLSFSLSLARLHPQMKICATVLEPEAEFLRNYVSGTHILQNLRYLPNVTIVFGVDATKLNLSQGSFGDMYYKFTDLVMNFPHHCGKTNLRRSRELIYGIFKSASEHIMVTSETHFHMSFAKGQSGVHPCWTQTGAIFQKEEPKHEKDSWQLLEIAAQAGLRAEFVRPFRPEKFPEYQCAGYKNSDQWFHNKNGSETFTFVYNAKHPMEFEEAKLTELCTNPQRFCRIPRDFHLLRPWFKHDISILFGSAIENDINQAEDELYKIIQLLVNSGNVTQNASKEPETKKANEDGDFDLFGSDDEEDKETEEQKRIREERLAAYAAKKAKKPGLIAKSSVILDVKPWDDETSLEEMEKQVRSIQMDGLLWGAAKQIPIGYGIKKLQIVSTVEDEKVSVDDLIDQIQGFEDYVQSVDVVAFNKI
ncbi:EF-1 guanine nucleotide exchange domain-containing protein [Ditylenchus destructor]|uniref:EF-1 guanine nucleotide exchange domain-containing protein n=1 Tax=Ditylenchus destructor TaxID=166010 RepID=A0AAD4NEB0_9BILA|nr:EF-1 guanine nucleotide exchange domain-containing protein [Ditylenchus destructor]